MSVREMVFAYFIGVILTLAVAWALNQGSGCAEGRVQGKYFKPEYVYTYPVKSGTVTVMMRNAMPESYFLIVDCDNSGRQDIEVSKPVFIQTQIGDTYEQR